MRAPGGSETIVLIGQREQAPARRTDRHRSCASRCRPRIGPRRPGTLLGLCVTVGNCGLRDTLQWEQDAPRASCARRAGSSPLRSFVRWLQKFARDGIFERLDRVRALRLADVHRALSPRSIHASTPQAASTGTRCRWVFPPASWLNPRRRARGAPLPKLFRAGLAVVDGGRHPCPATSPDDMRTQDVPAPPLDRDPRADTEDLGVRVVDVGLPTAVRVTKNQDVTGDHPSPPLTASR
jgi:hypothetical protein